MGQSQPMIQRENFRVRLDKLKRGIVISWIVNFLLLTMTLESAAIFLFLQSSASNSDILKLLLISIPIAMAISAITMAAVSSKSWKSIALKLGTIEVDENTDRYLKNIVEEMSLAAGLRQDEIPSIGVIGSSEPNAFALSGPDGSMIAVTTGLLGITTRDELQGIIAHEIGHLIAGDTKAMTKLIAMASIVAIVSGLTTRFIFGKGGGGNKANPMAIALIVISLLFLLAAPFLSKLANSSMQRKRESQADAISVRLTRNPTALATALRKIEGSYSNIPKKDKAPVESATQQLAFFSRSAYSTHPSTDDRIYELKKMGADPTV